MSSLEKEIRELASQKKYKKSISALGCFRGISTLSAMSLLTEIGDVRRFSYPKKLVSYSGLDIIEYSSGGRSQKFGITKMGNRHIRTTLVEACQGAHRPCTISKALKKRREGQSLKFVDIGDRCMKRLRSKSHRLIYSSKPINKVKVACAREMLGFVWEALHKARVC